MHRAITGRRGTVGMSDHLDRAKRHRETLAAGEKDEHLDVVSADTAVPGPRPHTRQIRLARHEPQQAAVTAAAIRGGRVRRRPPARVQANRQWLTQRPAVRPRGQRRLRPTPPAAYHKSSMSSDLGRRPARRRLGSPAGPGAVPSHAGQDHADHRGPKSLSGRPKERVRGRPDAPDRRGRSRGERRAARPAATIACDTPAGNVHAVV